MKKEKYGFVQDMEYQFVKSSNIQKQVTTVENLKHSKVGNSYQKFKYSKSGIKIVKV
jgi:hypothetical protein